MVYCNIPVTKFPANPKAKLRDVGRLLLFNNNDVDLVVISSKKTVEESCCMVMAGVGTEFLEERFDGVAPVIVEF